MLVRSNKFFISAVFGNVDEGEVLNVSEAQAKLFIENGLASLVEAGPSGDKPKVETKPTVFHSPVEPQEAPGSSLPADPVSHKKIVSESGHGAKSKKGKTGKSR